MTSEQLDELERLEKAATKGKWWREECAEHGCQLLKYKWDDVPTWLAESSSHRDSIANFDLICALRNACPVLISLARIGLAAVEQSTLGFDGDDGERRVELDGVTESAIRDYLARKE